MKRILLIDDEEVITFGFARVLEAPDIQVDCAHTMGEARVYITTLHYAVAIVDLRLSRGLETEGFDCARLLQSHQRDCRIIMLTAYGGPVLKDEAMALGVDLFLEKPVKPEAIRDILKTFGLYNV